MATNTRKPLALALKSAFNPPSVVKKFDDRRLVEQLNETRHEINATMELKANSSKLFFAFESPEQSIEPHLTKLRKKKEQLLEKIREMHLKSEGQAMHIKMAKKGYPLQISPEFLTARKKDNMPTFMVMNLESKSVEIEIYSNFASFQPDLPSLLEKQFNISIGKIREKLNMRPGLSWNEKICASYHGILPPSARTEIQKAIDSKLFDEIFIVAEVQKWERIPTTPIKSDPLVLGWVERTQQLFVITIYDPTGIEQYVADQFAFGVTVPEEEE